MQSARARPGWVWALVAVLLAGAAVRAGVVFWSDPWGPHHPDEHILPLEALALWEGVTPREVGWPASTSRLVLSVVEAGELAVQKGHAVWQSRARPAEALAMITKWIGHQHVDSTGLYKTGRAVSVLLGTVQLIVLAWALSEWTGPIGVVIGTFAVAMGPLPVRYSQYVLADVFALLFATVLVGLAAKPTERRVIVMGALAALAAASKFHFGLWLLTPLLVALELPMSRARRGVLMLAAVGMCAWVVITLVPWFWVSPLLAIKEFLGVVAVKVGGGGTYARISQNAYVLLHGLTLMLLVGLLAGVYFFSRIDWRRMRSLWMPALLGFLILSASGGVFDRYALVLLPGLVVIAAAGWERWLTSVVALPQRIATALLAVCAVITLVSLWNAERMTGEIDVDVLAKRWVMDHVQPGSHIAVYDEMNALLPRTADQLTHCAEYVHTDEAYQRKFRSEGLSAEAVEDEPMRAMVLNDEDFEAYWCRRELDARSTPGFFVVRYHDAPRFDAVPENDVLHEFAHGGTAVTGGVDVLVINRDVDVGRPPAAVFATARGRRVIYRK